MGIINKKTKMNSKQKLNINIIHQNPFNCFESEKFSYTLNKKIKNIYNLQQGTNSNLLLEFSNEEYAIYKPELGERPLYDFPSGCLYKREYASYIFSLLLGWPNIPPTFIVNIDPYGHGSIQKIIFNKGLNYFDLLKIKTNDFFKFAIFDYLINNADRKGGHCILDEENKLWSIDHGVTFHEIFKVRTVMFDVWEKIISGNIIKDITKLKLKFTNDKNIQTLFKELLSNSEIKAITERLDLILETKRLPPINQKDNIPWPLI
tara:strand:+ start:209 stop:994 length:786 start_codon:yes stop_codon:yes gene_type:complete